MIKTTELFNTLTALADFCGEPDGKDFDSVLFHFSEDNEIKIVATDGYSLAVATFSTAGHPYAGNRFLINRKKLPVLFLGDTTSLVIYEENLIISDGTDTKMIPRRHSDIYPTYENCISSDPSAESVLLSNIQLKRALKLCKLTDDGAPSFTTYGAMAPVRLGFSTDGFTNLKRIDVYIMACSNSRK